MPSARDLLSADAYARSLGVTLLESGPEGVRVAMEVEGAHLDHRGRLSAGAVFSLADCAMSLISNAERTAVAVSAHLAMGGDAGVGARIEARAEPEHRSGGAVTWRIGVTAGDTPIALFTGITLELSG